MTGHALLSPSGSHKWLECPGSVVMEQGQPEGDTTYSDEGTAAHAVASMALTEGRPASAYVGRRIDIRPGKTVEVTQDMADGVQVYVDNVCTYAGRLVLGAEDQGLLHTLLVEQRVPIGHITGEADAGGTADAIVITADGEELQLHDLKFGRGVPVSSERNPQLMLYALGALEMVAPLGHDPKRIRLVIHQPRIQHAPDEWDCSIEELLAFGGEAKQKASRCFEAMRCDEVLPEELPKLLAPGPHCDKGFCKARATCPALALYVEQQVGASFEDLAAGELAPVPLGTDTPNADKLAVQMSAIDLIESWCKAVRAEVERRLLAGVPVPGYKLVAGRAGARSWADVEAAEKYLRDTVRLKVEQAYDMTLISPTSAEKLVKAGEIKPRQWTKLEGLITRRDPKPSVAPESDRRPAIVVKPVADQFEVTS